MQPIPSAQPMPEDPESHLHEPHSPSASRPTRTVVEAQIAADNSIRCTCGRKVGDLTDAGVEFVCNNKEVHGGNATVFLDLRERRLRLAEVLADNDRAVIALFSDFVKKRPGAADLLALALPDPTGAGCDSRRN